MEQYKIQAFARDITKKKVKRLRKAGLIPAAIYGYNGEFNIQLPEKEFVHLYEGVGNTKVVDVELNGKVHHAYISEVQVNPASRAVLHVSFREVSLKEAITASIPFVLVGADNSPAEKEHKHIIILAMPDVELRGLPTKMPSEITIDVSHLGAGDTIHIKDIQLPSGVVLVHTDSEYLNQVVVTTAPATQEETAEPEETVIDATEQQVAS
jgi:large subunit ribosomal protein L25